MWTSTKIFSRPRLLVRISYFASCVTEKKLFPICIYITEGYCQTPNIPVVTSTAHIHIFSDYLSSFLPQVLLPVRVSPILNPVVVLARVPPLAPHTSFAHAAATCRHAFTGRRGCNCPSERRVGRQDSFDSSMFQSKFIHCCITFICMCTLNTLQRLILVV